MVSLLFLLMCANFCGYLYALHHLMPYTAASYEGSSVKH